MSRDPFDRSSPLDRRADDDAADTRDDALSGALRGAVPEPPLDAVDWSALHARITAAAAPALERAAAAAEPRAAQRTWWQPLAGWSPRGIPLAAAASALLVMAVGALQSDAAPDDDEAAVAFLTVEEELANGLSSGARRLFADDGSNAMLDVALFAEGEDW